MSFYTVIYSSLGMLASWEIHEKAVKITDICWLFAGMIKHLCSEMEKRRRNRFPEFAKRVVVL